MDKIARHVLIHSIWMLGNALLVISYLMGVSFAQKIVAVYVLKDIIF